MTEELQEGEIVYEEPSRLDGLVGIIFIIFLIVMAYGAYWQYYCPWFDVPAYDRKISEISGKLNALGCSTPAEKDSAKFVRCNELVFEHNDLVAKRNALVCVNKESN